MKITGIETKYYELPLKTPISDAKNTITKRHCLLIKIRTDEGITGVGEAATFAGCGKIVQEAVRHFATSLISKDPLLPVKTYDDFYDQSVHYGRAGVAINALSGIDIALWDILGQKAGMPLYRMLGASRNSLQAYANAAYYVLDDETFLEKSIHSTLDWGFKAVKIKIGRFDFKDDVRRVKYARKLLGEDNLLMVDANGTLTDQYVRKLDPVLVDHNVRWIEEPISLRLRQQLKALSDAIRTPIAGYELESTSPRFSELISNGVVDIVQPDCIWSGGITECARIASVAHIYKCAYVPHNFASIVSLAANAHIAAAASTGGLLEVDSNENPFLWSVDKNNSFTLKNGQIDLPELPGLGLEIDWNYLEQYRFG